MIIHIYHVMIIVTGGFTKKSFAIIIFRSSCKQFSLEILKYSQENILQPAALFQPDIRILTV